MESRLYHPSSQTCLTAEAPQAVSAGRTYNIAATSAQGAAWWLLDFRCGFPV